MAPGFPPPSKSWVDSWVGHDSLKTSQPLLSLVPSTACVLSNHWVYILACLFRYLGYHMVVSYSGNHMLKTTLYLKFMLTIRTPHWDSLNFTPASHSYFNLFLTCHSVTIGGLFRVHQIFFIYWLCLWLAFLQLCLACWLLLAKEQMPV